VTFATVATALHKAHLEQGFPNIKKLSFRNSTATFAKPRLAIVLFWCFNLLLSQYSHGVIDRQTSIVLDFLMR